MFVVWAVWSVVVSTEVAISSTPHTVLHCFNCARFGACLLLIHDFCFAFFWSCPCAYALVFVLSPKMHTLNLYDNYIGDEGAKALV